MGIEVPTGITSQGLSQLIQDTVQANHRRAREDLPNEISTAGRMHPTPAWRIKAIEQLKQSGIRPGCLARYDREGSLGIIVRHDSDILVFTFSEFGTGYTYHETFTRFSLVYMPPTTHVHPLLSLHRPDDVPWRRHLKRALAFVDFAEKRLQAEHKFRNEFGEFWAVAATTQLEAEFVANERPKKKSDQEIAASLVRYCCSCGTKGSKRTLSGAGNGSCLKCLGKPVPDNRFCYFCGKPFVKDPAGNKSKQFRCPSCRTK